jgi:hypothetical protein
LATQIEVGHDLDVQLFALQLPTIGCAVSHLVMKAGAPFTFVREVSRTPLGNRPFLREQQLPVFWRNIEHLIDLVGA